MSYNAIVPSPVTDTQWKEYEEIGWLKIGRMDEAQFRKLQDRVDAIMLIAEPKRARYANRRKTIHGANRRIRPKELLGGEFPMHPVYQGQAPVFRCPSG
jgi:hypothetical protein